MIQYTIEDIKRMLLRCILEYSCEAELLIKFVDNENEYMIMMSDGISDSFANDRLLCDFISRLKTRNPQDMADAIKTKALENNNGRAIDDMSVLVVKIFTC